LVHRYYDPTTTQFLTVDPLVAETGEPYGYAGDNPINSSDPSGLCAYDVIGGVPQYINDKKGICDANGIQSARGQPKLISSAPSAPTASCSSGAWGYLGCTQFGWNNMSTTGKILDVVAIPVLVAGIAVCVIAEPCGAASLGSLFGCGTTATATQVLNNPVVDQGGGVATTSLSAEDQTLVEQLVQNGTKINPNQVLSIGQGNQGATIWIEQGSSSAGLEHVIEEHGAEFASRGISVSQLPAYLVQAVTKGQIVGYQGADNGRPIYQFVWNGAVQKVAVTVGSNGFIVGANPTS
jgi:hypothetical protein